MSPAEKWCGGAGPGFSSMVAQERTVCRSPPQGATWTRCSALLLLLVALISALQHPVQGSLTVPPDASTIGESWTTQELSSAASEILGLYMQEEIENNTMVYNTTPTTSKLNHTSPTSAIPGNMSVQFEEPGPSESLILSTVQPTNPGLNDTSMLPLSTLHPSLNLFSTGDSFTSSLPSPPPSLSIPSSPSSSPPYQTSSSVTDYKSSALHYFDKVTQEEVLTQDTTTNVLHVSSKADSNNVYSTSSWEAIQNGTTDLAKENQSLEATQAPSHTDSALKATIGDTLGLTSNETESASVAVTSLTLKPSSMKTIYTLPNESVAPSTSSEYKVDPFSPSDKPSTPSNTTFTTPLNTLDTGSLASHQVETYTTESSRNINTSTSTSFPITQKEIVSLSPISTEKPSARLIESSSFTDTPTIASSEERSVEATNSTLVFNTSPSAMMSTVSVTTSTPLNSSMAFISVQPTENTEAEHTFGSTLSDRLSINIDRITDATMSNITDLLTSTSHIQSMTTVSTSISPSQSNSFPEGTNSQITFTVVPSSNMSSTSTKQLYVTERVTDDIPSLSTSVASSESPPGVTSSFKTSALAYSTNTVTEMLQTGHTLNTNPMLSTLETTTSVSMDVALSLDVESSLKTTTLPISHDTKSEMANATFPLETNTATVFNTHSRTTSDETPPKISPFTGIGNVGTNTEIQQTSVKTTTLPISLGTTSDTTLLTSNDSANVTSSLETKVSTMIYPHSSATRTSETPPKITTKNLTMINDTIANTLNQHTSVRTTTLAIPLDTSDMVLRTSNDIPNVTSPLETSMSTLTSETPMEISMITMINDTSKNTEIQHTSLKNTTLPISLDKTSEMALRTNAFANVTSQLEISISTTLYSHSGATLASETPMEISTFAMTNDSNTNTEIQQTAGKTTHITTTIEDHSSLTPTKPEFLTSYLSTLETTLKSTSNLDVSKITTQTATDNSSAFSGITSLSEASTSTVTVSSQSTASEMPTLSWVSFATKETGTNSNGIEGNSTSYPGYQATSMVSSFPKSNFTSREQSTSITPGVSEVTSQQKSTTGSTEISPSNAFTPSTIPDNAVETATNALPVMTNISTTLSSPSINIDTKTESLQESTIWEISRPSLLSSSVANPFLSTSTQPSVSATYYMSSTTQITTALDNNGSHGTLLLPSSQSTHSSVLPTVQASSKHFEYLTSSDGLQGTTTNSTSTVTSYDLQRTTADSTFIVTSDDLQRTTTNTTSMATSDGLQRNTTKSTSTVTSDGLQQNTTNSTSTVTSDDLQRTTTNSTYTVTSDGLQRNTTKSTSTVTSDGLQQKTTNSTSTVTSDDLQRTTTNSTYTVTSDGLQLNTTNSISTATSNDLQRTTTNSKPMVTSDGLQRNTFNSTSTVTSDGLQQNTTNSTSTVTSDDLQRTTTNSTFTVTSDEFQRTTTNSSSTVTSDGLQITTINNTTTVTSDNLQRTTTNSTFTVTSDGLRGNTTNSTSTVTSDGLQLSTTNSISTATSNGLQRTTTNSKPMVTSGGLQRNTFNSTSTVTSDGLQQNTINSTSTVTSDDLQRTTTNSTFTITSDDLQRTTTNSSSTVTSDGLQITTFNITTTVTSDDLQRTTTNSSSTVTSDGLQLTTINNTTSVTSDDLQRTTTSDGLRGNTTNSTSTVTSDGLELSTTNSISTATLNGLQRTTNSTPMVTSDGLQRNTTNNTSTVTLDGLQITTTNSTSAVVSDVFQTNTTSSTSTVISDSHQSTTTNSPSSVTSLQSQSATQTKLAAATTIDIVNSNKSTTHTEATTMSMLNITSHLSSTIIKFTNSSSFSPLATTNLSTNISHSLSTVSSVVPSAEVSTVSSTGNATQNFTSTEKPSPFSSVTFTTPTTHVSPSIIYTLLTTQFTKSAQTSTLGVVTTGSTPTNHTIHTSITVLLPTTSQTTTLTSPPSTTTHTPNTDTATTVSDTTKAPTVLTPTITSSTMASTTTSLRTSVASATPTTVASVVNSTAVTTILIPTTTPSSVECKPSSDTMVKTVLTLMYSPSTTDKEAIMQTFQAFLSLTLFQALNKPIQVFMNGTLPNPLNLRNVTLGYSVSVNNSVYIPSAIVDVLTGNNIFDVTELKNNISGLLSVPIIAEPWKPDPDISFRIKTVLKLMGTGSNVHTCVYVRNMEQKLQTAFETAEFTSTGVSSNLSVQILNTSIESQILTLIYVLKNNSNAVNGTTASSLLNVLSGEVVGYYLGDPPSIIAEPLYYPNIDVSVSTKSYWVYTVIQGVDSQLLGANNQSFAQQMEERLATLFQISGQQSRRFRRATTVQSYTVQMVKMQRLDGPNNLAELTYYALKDGQPIQGTAAAKQLSTIDPQTMALTLGYIVKVQASSVVQVPPNNLWIIAAVLAPIAVVTVIIIIITAVLCRKNKSDFKSENISNLPPRTKPVQGFDYAKQHLGQQGGDEDVLPVTQETVVPSLNLSQERDSTKDGSTEKMLKSSDNRKSRSPCENGSVISNESEEASSDTSTPQKVMAQHRVTKDEACKRNGFPKQKRNKKIVPISDEEEGNIHFDKNKIISDPFDSSSGSVQLIAIKPVSIPPALTVSERNQEMSIINGEVNKALKQKSDIEHYRNKLRLKAKRKGYYDFPPIESKSLNDRKRKVYEKTQMEIDNVLDAGTDTSSPFAEPKNRQASMKNHPYRSRQSLNSPSPGETEMDLLVTRERPRRGIRNSGYDTEPEVIEETNIDRVKQARTYIKSRQTKGHSETSTLSSQPSIDEVRQQMHMLLEEAFSLASAGHGGPKRQTDPYASVQHMPYSEVVTSAPGTMSRPRVQWVPTYGPEMYQYSLPRPNYRFSQLPEMVIGSPPPPVPPRTGPVAVPSLRRSTSDMANKSRMPEPAGNDQGPGEHVGFPAVSRGPVPVAQTDQSVSNYSGNSMPAVFAIPGNRAAYSGYYIPQPPASYRNQAWMSYSGENDLPGQWADSVPLPGYIEAYPRSRYPQNSPSRLPRQFGQQANLHPSLDHATGPSIGASQQSLADTDTPDASITNLSTAALVKAIREEVAKLAKKQTDMFEFQV
ncbi:UPF0606 protein KIAA1549L homolog [Dendropsophus ebraccatus]|uniref:UPF0606 protein KIAA1549L homolog n=1 Tax=Dendropsophus ebraccatus TaxID=150705 RepID=UPI003831F2BA